MSQKILVVSSSPRKGGNSDILCDEFIKGASCSSNSIEKINLSDKKIGFCTGCYACQAGECPQKDDAFAIIQKMLQADVIVLSTPVYFYTMCAQLKALIDRSVMIYPQIQNKKFFYLMAMGDTNPDCFTGTIEALRGFVACCENSKELGMVCAPGFYEKGSIRNSEYCQAAYRLGKTLGK